MPLSLPLLATPCVVSRQAPAPRLARRRGGGGPRQRPPGAGGRPAGTRFTWWSVVVIVVVTVVVITVVVARPNHGRKEIPKKRGIGHQVICRFGSDSLFTLG